MKTSTGTAVRAASKSRRSAGLARLSRTCGVVLLAGSSIFLVGSWPGWAKGNGGQPLVSSAEGTDAFHLALDELLTPIPCGTPSPADCLDDNYGLSTCGKAHAGFLINHGTGVCAATCLGYEPNVDECQDAAFLNSICGQRERARMAIPDDYPDVVTVHPSICVNLLRTFGEEAQQNSPVTSVFGEPTIGTAVVPSAGVAPTGEDGNLTIDDESLLAFGFGDPAFTTEELPRIPPSYSDFTTDGAGTFFLSKVMHDDVGLRGADAANFQANFFDANRLLWDVNGNAAVSCREYAYEKYYDYSRWEDRTHFLGADARAKVQAAFDDSAEPWAIGSRQLDDPPVRLRRKDGLPSYEQLWFGSGDSHKNELFTVPVHSVAQDRTDAILAWETFGQKVRYTYKGEVYEGDTVHPVSLFHPIILDEDLSAILADGRLNHRVSKSWAWHDQMNSDLGAAGFPDEQLFAMDRLKEQFLQLLYRRNAAAQYIMFLIVEAYGTPAEEVADSAGLTNVFNPGEVIDPFDNQLELGTLSVALHKQGQRDAERNSGLLIARQSIPVGALGAGLGGLTVDIPGGAETSTHSGSGGYRGRGGLSNVSGLAQVLALQSGRLFSDVDLTLTESIFDRIVRLTQRLAVMDRGLEDYLHYAASYGCLDLEGPNPCDWSPDTFANRLKDAVATARERDYQRCLEYTPSGFDKMYADPEYVQNRFFIDVPPVQEYANTPSLICDLSAYNENTDDIDSFFRCVDLFRNQLLGALNNALDGGGVTLDPETNEVRISDSSSDGDSMGGSAFGASYAYEGRWSVTGLVAAAGLEEGEEEDWCKLKPHLHGHFDVGATAMYADVDLFTASGDVGLDPEEPRPGGYLEVVGETFIDVQTDDVPAASTFHIIVDEAPFKTKKFFSARATVTIGPIPVTIKAGLGGSIGTAFQLAVGSGGASGGQACSDGGSVLQATFAPFVSVYAFASVSLDALVVEAGVKISLTIAGVSFPFTTSLTTTGAALSNEIDVKLTARSKLDAVFSFLSGRVSAFVEFCFILCERIEATLFSWDGLRVVANLIDTELTVPLRPLAGVSTQGGAP